MITNTGKEIIAKYLLGTAPAYASYVALGCGKKPRSLVTSLSNASSSGTTISVTSTDGLWVGAQIYLSSFETSLISVNGTVGSISGSGPWTATITGMSDVTGIQIGHKLEATDAVGSLGAGGTYVVTAIPSSTSITFSATGGTTPTAGTITNIYAGTGMLSANTLVTSIDPNGTDFVVDSAPQELLYGATLTIEPDPATQVLDFEMFRVPITSRGYINDSGVNKLVLTAELPSEERYEISEVGIFSAGSNSTAGSADSKTVTAFSGTENWQYNSGVSLSAPEPYLQSIIDASNNLVLYHDAVQTNADNAAFLNATRASRYERCRYFNNIFMLRGNSSHITSDGSTLTVQSNPKFLQLTSTNVDLSKNSTSDLLKLVFSIVAYEGSASTVAENVRVLVEFSNGDGSQYARLQADVDVDTYQNNRYVYVEQRLDQLVYSSTFSWKEVTVIKIYTSALDTVTVTNKSASTTVATLTASGHGLPVNATVSNAVVSSTVPATDTIYGGKQIVTLTVAAHTFIPGDVINITGVTPSAFNLTNAVVKSVTSSTSFDVINMGTTISTTYTSGGTASIANAVVTISGVNGVDSGFDGTFTVSSVPSSSTFTYARTGSAVSSTGVTGSAEFSRSRYFISLDAIRFDNISSINPLYGLTGYSIIQNVNEETIVKASNTTNYIEFRIKLGVE